MVFFNKCVMLIMITGLLSACASQSALEKYQTKANEGDIQNQLMLAERYYFGAGGIPQDKGKAILYYRLAAKAGSDSAAFNLGIIYQQDGDFDQAVYYYEMASAANNFAAQDNLAVMYQNGAGVEKDITKAEELYLLALSNGSTYSKRNLAILYRDSQQTEKAIDMFKQLSFDPTTKDNSYKFKKAVALELMDLFLIQDDKENAYIWGTTAVLSGLFDSNIVNLVEKRTRYLAVRNALDDELKNKLSKNILQYHYKAFQQYEPAVQKYQSLIIDDEYSDLSINQLTEFTDYKAEVNKKTFASINHYKDQDDKTSRIKLALHTLKLAAYEISIGVISSQLQMAQKNIEKSISLLGGYSDSNLNNLKDNTKLKLLVVEVLSDYQQRLKEEQNNTK